MKQYALTLAEIKSNQTIVNGDSLAELVDNELIEDIWSDMDGRIDRARIREVASAVAHDFVDATVTTFVPLFIRRRTCERLQLLLD